MTDIVRFLSCYHFAAILKAHPAHANGRINPFHTTLHLTEDSKPVTTLLSARALREEHMVRET